MSDQTEQLEKLGEEWATAELSGDTGYLGHILADDFVAIGPRGFMLIKEQWLSRHDSGSLKYESFGWDGVRVHGDAAVVTGQLRLPRGDTKTRTFATTSRNGSGRRWSS